MSNQLIAYQSSEELSKNGDLCYLLLNLDGDSAMKV